MTGRDIETADTLRLLAWDRDRRMAQLIAKRADLSARIKALRPRSHYRLELEAPAGLLVNRSLRPGSTAVEGGGNQLSN